MFAQRLPSSKLVRLVEVTDKGYTCDLEAQKRNHILYRAPVLSEIVIFFLNPSFAVEVASYSLPR